MSFAEYEIYVCGLDGVITCIRRNSQFRAVWTYGLELQRGGSVRCIAAEALSPTAPGRWPGKNNSAVTARQSIFPGMLRRILAPVFVWIAGPHEPTDPGWGTSPPTDPGYGRPGWSPADPGYDLGAGLRPSNDLPWAPVYPGHGLPHPPARPDIKPPGYPILPVDPDWDKPIIEHPWLPGNWVPVDPGFGLPPIWGFRPVDPGWGVGGGGGAPLPGNELPGHWVPIDGDYGKPEGPCGGHTPKHVWVWIAHIDKDFGLRPAQPK
jgi:hypothetical protein